jgi:hypothetical protein
VIYLSLGLHIIYPFWIFYNQSFHTYDLDLEGGPAALLVLHASYYSLLAFAYEGHTRANRGPLGQAAWQQATENCTDPAPVTKFSSLYTPVGPHHSAQVPCALVQPVHARTHAGVSGVALGDYETTACRDAHLAAALHAEYGRQGHTRETQPRR